MKKAIIYCRVSSDKQAREGHGLEGQEKRCRDFAFYNEFEVEEIFKDQAVSGGLIDRPGMQALLDYVIKRGGEYAIIVDDINRFARDVVAHFTLKKAIKDAGCELFCVNMKLEDNPEGHFIETIMAASAELERNRNKRQVCNRMKARLELGYWVFDSPPGYKYLKDPAHGKILVLDEPKATVVREAIEGFALDRFITQQDVQAFLTQKKFTHRGKFKKVHLVQVKRILTRALYAGIIDYPEWGIKEIQGKHEAIVPQQIFRKSQEKLLGRAKKPFSRQNIHADFPVRGFVLCSGCEKPLTASW
jgi:site-specific DNA recombinase